MAIEELATQAEETPAVVASESDRDRLMRLGREIGEMYSTLDLTVQSNADAIKAKQAEVNSLREQVVAAEQLQAVTSALLPKLWPYSQDMRNFVADIMRSSHTSQVTLILSLDLASTDSKVRAVIRLGSAPKRSEGAGTRATGRRVTIGRNGNVVWTGLAKRALIERGTGSVSTEAAQSRTNTRLFERFQEQQEKLGYSVVFDPPLD